MIDVGDGKSGQWSLSIGVREKRWEDRGEAANDSHLGGRGDSHDEGWKRKDVVGGRRGRGSGYCW